MSEAFIGQIRMFAGNFAPRTNSFCDGQLLAISQNDALFSLLGTIYGGDGRSTFGLPDLRGRLPVHMGSGPGLTLRRLGSRYGTETVTLTQNEIPSHTHALNVSANAASLDSPAGAVAGATTTAFYSDIGDPNKVKGLASQAILNNGGSQRHNNLMPSLCLNFIIALTGTYPSRN